MPNEIKRTKLTRAINATAAGTTVITGASVDMSGFDGCLIIACLGTISATAVTTLSALQSPDNATWAALPTPAITASMTPTTDNNKCLILDVYRPQQRYLQANLNRATGNAVIDSVVYLQYAYKKAPTVHDATTVAASAFFVGS